MKKAEMAITEAPNKAANARFMEEEEGEEDDDDESISGFFAVTLQRDGVFRGL